MLFKYLGILAPNLRSNSPDKEFDNQASHEEREYHFIQTLGEITFVQREWARIGGEQFCEYLSEDWMKKCREGGLPVSYEELESLIKTSLGE